MGAKDASDGRDPTGHEGFDEERLEVWDRLANEEISDWSELNLTALLGTLRDDDGDIVISVVDVPIATFEQAQNAGHLYNVRLDRDQDGDPYVMGLLVLGGYPGVLLASESFTTKSAAESGFPDGYLDGLLALGGDAPAEGEEDDGRAHTE